MKSLIRLTFLIVTFYVFSIDAEAEIYKCQNNNAITYSESPCKNGLTIPIKIPDSQVSPLEYQRAIDTNKKEKTELQKLQHSRRTEEEKTRKEMKAVAAKNEKVRQKCDDLRLNAKWAKEDLSNASRRNEEKAKSKLKRAIEKAEASCKAR